MVRKDSGYIDLRLKQQMASPQIKILISLASISAVYAFVFKIQLSQKASKLSNMVQKERPDLWSKLNVFARNYDGGYPGLKILYRRKVVGIPMFDRNTSNYAPWNGNSFGVSA